VSAIDNVLDRLERVRKAGNGWYARCPAHDDRNPSLKLALGDSGRVLLSCKVGCRTEDILTSLDLEWQDLFEPDDSLPRQPSVPKLIKRNSESSSPPLSRQEIEGDWDSGLMSFEEYRNALDAWYLGLASVPPKSRVTMVFDEHGEVTGYSLLPSVRNLDSRPLGEERLAEVLRVLEETKP
jgi:hypothetical protein